MKPNKLALALQQIRTDLAAAETEVSTASHLEKAALAAHKQAKTDLKSARKASKNAAKLKAGLKKLETKASGAKSPKPDKKGSKRPQAKRETL